MALTQDDLDKALQRRTRRPIVLSAEEERVIAIHEAGHALVAMLLPRATPPERISITQDLEGALGYVMREARARPYAMTTDDMRAEICVGLGGQAAEQMVLGEISVGASLDLRQATELARSMVESYGMSGVIGPRVVTEGDMGHGGRGLSESRLNQLDAEIDKILREEKERAAKLLVDNSSLHNALVVLLLEKKVLDAGAIKNLVPPTDTAKS
jgi:cell division protease FtsH